MWAPSTKSSTARSRSPRSLALAVSLAAALAAAGCVSQGEYDRVVGELRNAEDDGEAKQRSIEALEAERDKLLAEIEDLRDARESLKRDVSDRDQKMVKLRSTYDQLVQELEEDVNANALHIERLTEGMSFRLPQDVLFGPGSADLSVKGKQAVRDVAGRIGAGDDRVEVQGHTDDRAPGRGGRYPTNWELAGARAASVVRVLEEAGVDPKRLSAASYGSTRPLVSNDTPEGRAQNRRIEVRMIPSGPAKAPAPPDASVQDQRPQGSSVAPADPSSARDASGPQGAQPAPPSDASAPSLEAQGVERE